MGERRYIFSILNLGTIWRRVVNFRLPAERVPVTHWIQRNSTYTTFWAGKGKVIPVLNYAPRHDDVLGD